MKRYFLCTLAVEVEDDGWDSGCDETFGVAAAIGAIGADAMVDYEPITKELFGQQHFVFDENGSL